MKRVGKKFGDTLIEVTIAIGIFSMVAVAVVAVVSSSTSGAQSSLETTVTREELDAQAEAIRFIQSAYTNDTSDSNRYTSIWKAITAGALSGDKDMSYNPSTCTEPYSKLEENNAFIINYRAIGTGQTSDIVLRPTAKSGSGKVTFAETNTYPRLVYNDTLDLLNDNALGNNTLQRAEGIFVIAVRDPGDTTIAEGNVTDEKSAYYDFYIRSCWYAAHDNTPSTISTVIRLYDPDVDDSDDWSRGKTSYYNFIYHDQSGANNWTYTQGIRTLGQAEKLTKNRFSPPTEVGYTFTFRKWCTNPVSNNGLGSCSGTEYANEAPYFVPLALESKEIHLYAEWDKKENPKFTVKYDKNGGTGTMQSQTVLGGVVVELRDNRFTRTGHTFTAWCTKRVGVDQACTGERYSKPNNNKYATKTTGGEVTMYAMWKKNPAYTIYYHANGGTGTMNSNSVLGGLNITVSNNKFSRVDHAFAGWCTVAVGVNKSCTGTTYAEGKTFTTSAAGGSLHLYAMWKQTCNFTEKDFIYTGSMQSFTVPTGCSGTFLLEAWGAQGGTSYGGKGGYAYGTVTLNAGQTIYIGVGQQGNAAGGWNGGGKGRDATGSGGGGATHFGKVNATVANSGGKSNLYLVAGGGGGGTGASDISQTQIKVHDGTYYSPDDCGSYGSNGKDGCGEYSGTGGWVRINKPNFPFSIVGGNGGTTGGNGAIPSHESLHPVCASSYRGTSCQEKFIKIATGGTQSAGGSGGAGTDHYDPPVYGAGIKNGSGAFYGIYTGQDGSFGQGGGKFSLKRQMYAQDGSIASGGYDGNQYQCGGGGGLYGGGAGGLSSMYAPSGGGGSSYTGGVSNGKSTAAASSTQTGNGKAHIKRL